MSVIELLKKEYEEIKANELEILGLYEKYNQMHDYEKSNRATDTYHQLVFNRAEIRDAIQLLVREGFK